MIATQVQVYGTCSIRDDNAKLFYVKFVGGQTLVDEKSVVKNFKSLLAQNVSTLVAQRLSESKEEILNVGAKK